METGKINIRFGVLAGMLLFAALSRILPHPLNFTPIGAMALFGGAYFQDKRLAFLVPLLALFVGDIFIGFHILVPVIYFCFLLNTCIGLYLRNHPGLASLFGATLIASISFFVLSNFGLWAIAGYYPRTLAGLTACYVAAIPYFWNTLAGDMFYVAILFGCFEMAKRRFPVLALEA